jgi:hypothetical protein
VYTHYAIILSLKCWDFEALFLRGRPWFRKYVVDDRRNWVVRKAHGPREVRDGVVFYDVPDVAPALHRISGHAAGGKRACTSAHGNRICCMPYMCDVVR